MSDSMVQPFRRNLQVAPIIGPIGLEPVPTRVLPMTDLGVTSFIVINPNPFWFWFAGWKGQMNAMPLVKERGHYIAPGEKYLGRTQMPDWVAGCADAEINFPILDEQGQFMYAGQRPRFILLYGSGL